MLYEGTVSINSLRRRLNPQNAERVDSAFQEVPFIILPHKVHGCNSAATERYFLSGGAVSYALKGGSNF